MRRYGSQDAPFHEDMLPRPQDPYAIAKVAAEKLVVEAKAQAINRAARK